MSDRRRCRSYVLAVLLLAGIALLPVACSRPTDLPAEIEAQVEAYRKEPSDALQSRIEASFAKLDAEIAEIRADADTKTGAAKDEALAKVVRTEREPLEQAQVLISKAWEATTA